MPVEVLGIDFGTSNTVAVLSGGGRPPRVLSIDGGSWMSSAVFVEDDGSLAVGRDAERRARLAPERFEPNPKRRIDDGEILLGVRVVPVVDAIAAVLRRVGEEARRQLNGRNPDQVHLTHPAQWGAARQNVLLAAARAAGLGAAISLLPEPVGAAAHFASLPGNALRPGAVLAVYDLGGGTFDCAVVGATPTGYAVLAEAGLPDVGGVDFDQTVVDHLGRTAAAVDPGRWQSLTRPRTAGDRRAARSLREDVRAAKETLSRYSQTDLPLPEPFEDTLLTRREFDGLIRPGIVRTVELLAGTIARAGVAPPALAGVYLVGGSSRIPLVATVISEKLGVVATTLDQPETSVAMGAAISPGGPRPVGRTESLGPRSVPGVPAPGRPPMPGPPAPMPGPPASMPGPSVSGPHPGAGSPPATPTGTTGPALARPGSATGPNRGSTTGPLPGSTTGPHPAPTTGPHPASMTGPHPPAGGRSASPTGGRRRPLVIGIAAAVVAAVVAVTLVLVLGNGSHGAGGDTPTTSSSTTATGARTDTSPTAPTEPGVPVVPATCETSPVDASTGMTPCLQAVAGPNADLALGCVVATDNPDMKTVLGSLTPVASSACAGLHGGQVDIVYIQFGTADDATSAIDALAGKLALSGKDWHSGGDSGRYLAYDADDGPQIYWSYSDVPVIGLAVTDSSGTNAGKAPLSETELTTFWQGSLLPQASS